MIKTLRRILRNPLRKKSFRRVGKLITDALWSASALMVLFAVIFSNWWMMGIALVLFVYCVIQRLLLVREEKRIIDCLTLAADFNIKAAKHSAQYGERQPHRTLYTVLSVGFGEHFAPSLKSHHMGWIKERYDEIIEKITGADLRTEQARETLQSIGEAEQRRLESYYRGKKEVREDFLPEGNFDSSRPRSEASTREELLVFQTFSSVRSSGPSHNISLWIYRR